MTTAATPRRVAWLMSFTGLLPLALTVPLLLLHFWALGIFVNGVGALIIIGFHLRRGQGITGLDVLSLACAIANAVLYFGYHTIILLEHLDTVIYSLLGLQVLYAQLRGEPWTIQFAKRAVAPELWATPEFLTANRGVSLLWGACFVCSAAVSLWRALGAWQTLIPAALLVSMAVFTPRLARWFGRHI
jgi:hypothetical protein